MLAAVRLVLIFAVVLSLASLPGPLSRNLPTVPFVKASPAPFVEQWYPAGPAMDTLQVSIFLDQVAEVSAIIQTPPPIDFSDAPLAGPQISTICPSPAYFCTNLVSDHGYFELEFNLANTFWGINMNFGNDPSGVLLRQGIAHLINKNIFVAQQADIAGLSAAIDNPVPAGSSFAGHALATPNPCGWDLNFTETGSSCQVGAPGGTAYNCSIGASCPTGTIIPGTNFAWQPAIGSADFCAAATHFKDAFNRVIPGGGVTLNASCILVPPGSTTPDATGTVWQSKVASWTSVNMFARIDHHPRLQLGQSIAQELCGLFTGSLTTRCGNVVGGVELIVSGTEETITSFPGFTTDPTRLSLTWQIYTAGFNNIFPFDQSLYFIYNSRFVSVPPTVPPCSAQSVPSFTAPDYMFLCSPAYDVASSQMEFAPCLAAPGDVDTQIGKTSATLVNCPNTTQTTALSSALKATDIFGRGAFTIPIWTGHNEFAYLSNWHRAINADGAGTPNFFTWLNAWTATPGTFGCPTAQPVCIRQGFSETTRSLNPYTALTAHDFFILQNIYDSLSIENPANKGQVIEWMTADPAGPTEFPCSGGVCPGLGYVPPAGTVDNFRFTLRGDLFWQDASTRPLTGFVSAWDVKFTYATMVANGVFQSASIASIVCKQPGCVDGITVKGPRQFDIHINATGPFTLPELGGLTILSGRLWSTCSAAAWDSDVATGSVPDACMTVVPAKLSLGYDPLCGDSSICPANPAPGGILIGSGAYECLDTFGGTSTLGKGCSSTGRENPGVAGAYTLTRFGYGTGAPSTAPSNRIYFRSSSNAAKWIWTNDNGGAKDVGNLVAVLACLNAAVAALGPVPDPNLGFPNGCAHWQQGIGDGGGTTGHPVGPAQIVIVLMYLGVRWVAPFDWTGTFGVVPAGIAPFPLVFYEGSYVSGGVTIRPTLNPASIAGCGSTFDPASPASGGYDC